MRMALASHQLRRTFPDAFGSPAAQEAAMVQEELEHAQVLSAELAAQREVVAQLRIQVFDQRARTWCLHQGPFHGVKYGPEFAANFDTQLLPALPICGRWQDGAIKSEIVLVL